MKAKTSEIVVYRPGAGTWGLYLFVTLLLAFNSLYFFFDPVPPLVRILGGTGIGPWVLFLLASSTARLELREETLEVFGPPYRMAPSRSAKVFFVGLGLFVLYDLTVLLLGKPPLWVRQLRLVVSLLLLAFYLLLLLRQLEPGRRSIRYVDILEAPREVDWGPVSWNQRKGLFMEVATGSTPFQFPPWLTEEKRQEVLGRVTARMKHAKALAHPQERPREETHSPEEAPPQEPAAEGSDPA